MVHKNTFTANSFLIALPPWEKYNDTLFIKHKQTLCSFKFNSFAIMFARFIYCLYVYPLWKQKLCIKLKSCLHYFVQISQLLFADTVSLHYCIESLSAFKMKKHKAIYAQVNHPSIKDSSRRRTHDPKLSTSHTVAAWNWSRDQTLPLIRMRSITHKVHKAFDVCIES